MCRSGDAHVDAVFSRLPASVRAVRLDLDLFPRHVGVDLALGPSRSPQVLIVTKDYTCDVSDVGTVWLRSVDGRTPHPRGVGEQFAADETRATVAGVLHLLRRARWFNSYEATLRALSKVYQLDVARRCGLLIPETLITNRPTAGGGFIDAAPAVYKTIGFPVLPEERRICTTSVDGRHAEQLRRSVPAPWQFQREIARDCDVRVTWVAGRFHVVEIRTSNLPPGTLDWKACPRHAIDVTPGSLPESVARNLRAMVDEMELDFGAIDLIRTPDGSHVFLEINTADAGWGPEEPTGRCITAAVAGHLATLATRRETRRV